jgi:hypothetical protein
MSRLKQGHRLIGAISVLVLGLSALSARAETVTKLFESTTLVTGTNMNLTELNLSSPGKLLIELDDLNWPGLLGTLSFSLTDATHVLQTFTVSGADKGLWSFDVSSPATLYGVIFAKPSATAKAGMYYAKVGYQTPLAAPVPLPAAAWFLISGIAGFAALRPKQKL